MDVTVKAGAGGYHSGEVGGIVPETFRIVRTLLNRLDDLIVFHMLEKKDLVKIVDLEISKVIDRLKSREISVKIYNKAKDFLIEDGYDPEYGARPMRRSVEKHLEDPLAEHLLRGDVKDGDFVGVTFDKKENKLKFKAQKSEPVAEKA